MSILFPTTSLIVGLKAKLDAHGFGSVTLDGREVPGIREIKLKASVDAITKAEIELLLPHGAEFEAPAVVSIYPVILEPGVLEIERSNDGKTQRIRFIREAP